MPPEPDEMDQPITVWLRMLEDGDSDAARPLWEHFCQKLMQLAAHQLNPKLRRAYDEEDAALSAFHSMCRVISDGRQTDLSNRENLWRLLVVITERKILHRRKYETREKRDVRRTLGESSLHKSNSQDLSSSGQVLPSREPTPEFAAEFADNCGRLLDELNDETLRQIVELRLTNHDNAEIADRLGMTRRTVERKLLLIRARWERLAQELDPA